MLNYKKYELGNISNIKETQENGKIFLHDILSLTGAQISINCVNKGFKEPFTHKHKQNEEIYIFLKGNGIMTIDGEKIEVKEGSCIKVMPQCSRTLINTKDEEMQFICIQTKLNSLQQYGLQDAEICS